MKKYIRLTLIHIILVVSVIITTFPLVRIFSVSIRPGDRIFSTELNIIPQGATFISYIKLFNETYFLRWIFNSFIITLTTSFIGVILASSAAYAFSRYKFFGKKWGLFLLLFTQMIPAGMLILPLYLMIMKLNLINTYLGMIIAYSVSSLPFSIWILKGYYDTIPRSLEEAAKVDGTTDIGAFYRIIIPLSKPALSIAFLFNFTMAWNEYLVARVVLYNPKNYTWTLGLFELQGQFITQWGMFAAGSILITIPVLIIFFYTSKYLVSGLTLGSVKG
ncbi:MAG: ABC transporter permease subunit [Elusimicrobiales bacterium]|nr:ABC transporter permease subunit [Elusimicrobiales bacterium]